ncbi:bifunctional nicotinamide-nucleotide adenylyltransferase/Nudix hydroxylase [Fastidiosibacter lacustris]|uniref:bifunctional nicotinamide-nucleotide adenylyltransferase/Nudix hydroxylase n=1 Tax=Fastidiosibacter lacustris TaxID=2056695 RepID=UPI000E34BAF6|nr:bifunctional nicotinamide-nucleotide adenylyltransferase/Nudix hydroxylase [Fastidiosibacter lacustris]
MQYSCAVFIGRFQPFHIGHLHNIQYALKIAQKLIIVVGSAFRAPSIKNPFSYELRRKMILSDLIAVGIDISRITIVPVSDWFYDENGWKNEVTSSVYNHVRATESIAIVGHEKDVSSYYLKCFPKWYYINVNNFNGFNATDFRMKFFGKHNLDETYLVNNLALDGTREALRQYIQTPLYQDLCDEFDYIQSYQHAWQDAPYKPIFVTTDAMVLCNKHVLLIQRKLVPGRNLWAFPGGFLDQDERIVDGMLRELEEETSIDIKSYEFSQKLIAQEVFDYPERSLKGRVITHLGLFILQTDSLPKLQAQDDAKSAKWIKLTKVIEKMSDCLIDDHYQIIRFMLTKYKLTD